MEQQKIIQNKKGKLGMDVVPTVIVLVLICAIVAFSLFISLNSLTQENVIPRKTIAFQTFANNTLKNFSSVTQQPSALAGLVGVILRDTLVTNGTGGEVITSTNYTITGSNFTTSGASRYNFTDINVSSTYSYTVPSDAAVINQNVTKGTADFFSNIPTIMTALGAVIIVLAITLILWAINRFSTKTNTGGAI